MFGVAFFLCIAPIYVPFLYYHMAARFFVFSFLVYLLMDFCHQKTMWKNELARRQTPLVRVDLSVQAGLTAAAFAVDAFLFFMLSKPRIRKTMKT